MLVLQVQAKEEIHGENPNTTSTARGIQIDSRLS